MFGSWASKCEVFQNKYFNFWIMDIKMSSFPNEILLVLDHGDLNVKFSYRNICVFCIMDIKICFVALKLYCFETAWRSSFVTLKLLGCEAAWPQSLNVTKSQSHKATKPQSHHGHQNVKFSCYLWIMDIKMSSFPIEISLCLDHAHQKVKCSIRNIAIFGS